MEETVKEIEYVLANDGNLNKEQVEVLISAANRRLTLLQVTSVHACGFVPRPTSLGTQTSWPCACCMIDGLCVAVHAGEGAVA